MRTVFELRSENLTGLGGPMGTEQTWDNWRKLFASSSSARKFAEKDFDGPDKLVWKPSSDGKVLSTQDLRWVMYHVTALEVHE